ncbi:DUF1572 family protein [Salipaludibacillus aurantiacus]|uniref:DUF1572 domain-containing protein n=1 Tax=Salipaludibacillus aurantiacus TaxID=1601833 RepID=A0A1H9Q8S1_9BACI|nr:DUF1572 family protein [Salipaludibacillus aurantiacus]SER56788.1 Protein of unknown function [Salipaludibacillus aurantiacus]
MTIGNKYLQIIIERFLSIKSLGDKTLNQLSEEDIHWQYIDQCNSTAAIVKHMSGNMVSRWTDFLTSDGEKPDRKRDDEFVDDISSKVILTRLWEEGWQVLMDTLEGLSEEDLLKEVTIRGEKHLVIEAIERQVAHYASHTGQLIYIAKQLKNEEWETLSIPKGKSDEYLKYMTDKHKGK